ncbi:MAG: hypothetical protein ACKPKO_30755, partial [Candidatus Fonsibacter sp.]
LAETWTIARGMYRRSFGRQTPPSPTSSRQPSSINAQWFRPSATVSSSTNGSNNTLPKSATSPGPTCLQLEFCQTPV